MGDHGFMAQQCVNFCTALMLLQGKSKRPRGLEGTLWLGDHMLHLNKATTAVQLCLGTHT